MLDDLKTVAAALKFLGFSGWEPRSDYVYRFNIQKIAYLCKAMGIPLTSYDFSIYLHGPYSRALAIDYTTHAAAVAIDQGDSSRDHAFSGGERDALRLLKDVVFSNGLMRSHPAEFLETLSTVVFFFVNENDYSHDSLVRKVKKIKPHLSKRILSVAVNVAKELLLSVNPPTATMVEEVKAWERMGDGLDKDITDPPGNGEKTTLLDPYKT
nr:hypothetical protein [Candidatus Sigynarchaeota archaeon]